MPGAVLARGGASPRHTSVPFLTDLARSRSPAGRFTRVYSLFSDDPSLPAVCPHPIRMLERKPFLLAVVVALSAGTGFALPPTTGAQWWSTDPNLTCTAYRSLIYEVPLASGGKGYACGITGTFVWYAAGGSWGTSIRIAAPASGAVGVQYLFFDEGGNRISLDAVAGAAQASGNSLGLAIGANQPSEVRLLGASSDAPAYQKTQTGSVFGVFLCSTAAACATVSSSVTIFVPVRAWMVTQRADRMGLYLLAAPAGGIIDSLVRGRDQRRHPPALLRDLQPVSGFHDLLGPGLRCRWFHRRGICNTADPWRRRR